MPRASRADPLGVAELTKALQEETRAADPLRADQLERLGRLRSGRAAALERERARLLDELTEDDPRVVAIDDRLTVDRDVVTAAAVQAERARTEAPTVGERSWALQGRVLASDLSGVPDTVVSVHDATGAWIEVLGRACTDERGRFLLTYEPADKTEDPRATRGEAPHIEVHDAKGNPLAVDERPIAPTAGRVDYAEIVLGEPPRACPPPPSSRRVKE